MDPFLGILVVTWVIKNFFTDMAYAVRGQDAPRHKLKMARLKQAGGNYTAPRYMTGDYFKDLWSDGLEASTARRRAKKAAKARLKLAEADTPPTPLPTVAPSEPVRDRPETLADLDDRPLAPVIPMFPNRSKTPPAGGDTTNEEENDMPIIPAGEILSLPECLSYNQALINALGEVASDEGYLGSLVGNKVSGAALTSAEAAQEASQMAADMWLAHYQEMEKQMAVKEAYDANPDAGDKDFLTGG